ncbi:hypothetical protein M0638_27975 [Roseomonas sp. NAR14]|uniref:Uncharacterized protein n=1 Tax=Roseomonas acroporae TaxID=2937791 RepID=A0A9X1YGC8_9PROT|nr:hypothetical protein [Roseomonas acroporae]MCK8788192.1 hypothetical protein [Roseomonas acroporae]
MLLRALIGYLTPVSYSAMALLRQTLKREGINPDALPPALLQEMCAEAIMVSRLLAKTRPQQLVRLTDGIEGAAYQLLFAIERGGHWAKDPSLQERLRRHGVTLGPHLLVAGEKR